MRARRPSWTARALAAVALAAAATTAARPDDDGGALKGWLKKKVTSAVSQELGQETGASPGRTERLEKAAASVAKTAKAFRRSAEDISESEEYYIGRSVAAQILARYRPYDSESVNRYVQSVTQAVAAASDRPLIFKGYHAQVLDSDEVNAFAAPGGFVFVTTGLLRLLQSEDQLACVLAHELAHVSEKHGLKTIKAARLAQAFELLGTEAASNAGSAQAARLAETFGGSVDDIVNDLVIKGYSRDKELAADREAVVFARRADYHPKGLTSFLSRLKGSTAGLGLLKTHPSPDQRLRALAGADLSPAAGFRLSQGRRRRFAASLRGV